MERTIPPFRWFRAYRVIMLVLSILIGLTAVLFVVAITFFRMAALHESPPTDFVAWLDALRVLVYQCLAQFTAVSLLFLATFIALKMRRRAGIYLAIAQNALLPISILLYIPMSTAYFHAFTRSLTDYTGGSLSDEIAVLSVLINTVVPVSCVISAIVVAAVLVPNSIYFYKRLAFIHLEDVSV